MEEELNACVKKACLEVTRKLRQDFKFLGVLVSESELFEKLYEEFDQSDISDVASTFDDMEEELDSIKEANEALEDNLGTLRHEYERIADMFTSFSEKFGGELEHVDNVMSDVEGCVIT